MCFPKFGPNAAPLYKGATAIRSTFDPSCSVYSFLQGSAFVFRVVLAELAIKCGVGTKAAVERTLARLALLGSRLIHEKNWRSFRIDR
jgi:hypothetical protein